VELAVTLVLESDPVRGAVRLPDGQQHEFWGWLELAEIVQRVAEGGGAEEFPWGAGSPEGAASPW
jgi:hypothetical protein